MSIEKIPFGYLFDDCNPRYDLLHQINLIFGKGKQRNFNVPPMLKFIGLLKEKFCTACCLHSINDIHLPGNSTTINSLLDDLKGLKESKSDQDYIIGYNTGNNETFLALLLPEEVSKDAGDSFALIMLRKRRIFTPEDVIVARACVNLFFSRFREDYAAGTSTSSTTITPKKMTTAEVITKASYQMGGRISISEISHLYGEALNLVCKSVVITESDGTLIHMNTMAETLFKRTLRGGEAMVRLSGGIDWFAGLIHPDDLTLLVSTWNTAHDSKTEFVVDFRLLTLNNIDYHLFRCHSKPIKNDTNDTVHYWIFCMYDMEQSRLMEETKLAATRKTKFLAEMSHEIRTPLACVIGTCSLLRYTPLSKEQNELLNTIRVCSQQLFTLTNNILDLSKIEESKLVLESRPVNLERALTDVIDIFVPDLVRKDIDVAVNISYPEVPETVMSDEGRLRQVITNILSNAIKFTRENSTVTISIQVRKKNEDSLNHSSLKFEFTDEGPGIPDTVPQSQLFDTFVQLDSSTFRKFGGSGLGLTISKKLVNLLGGDIWYESTVGLGTTMIFTIPLRQPTPIELANTSESLDLPSSPSSYRHMFSLREFLNTFQAHGVVSVLVAMRKAKMNAFLLQTFHKIDLINVIQVDESVSVSVSVSGSENVLISEIIKYQPTILITDLIEFVPELKRVLDEGMLKSVILLTNETDTQQIEDRNRFRCLRKPAKPAILIKTAHEVFLSILSKSLPEKQTTESTSSIVPSLLMKSKWLGETGTASSSALLEAGTSASGDNNGHSITSDASVSFETNYPLKIMLAEDNLLNQQLMTRILAKYGYDDVIVVDNGRKAFDAFSRLYQQGGEPIEAIFMDMQMPEVEGPEATQLIRTFCRGEGCPQPHVMALTAKAFSEDRADCLRAGMCTYLSKPVRWSTLEDELIQAHGAYHDIIKCSCNEGRYKDNIVEEDLACDNKSCTDLTNAVVAPSKSNDSAAPLPIAKSTGLDV